MQPDSDNSVAEPVCSLGGRGVPRWWSRSRRGGGGVAPRWCPIAERAVGSRCCQADFGLKFSFLLQSNGGAAAVVELDEGRN